MNEEAPVDKRCDLCSRFEKAPGDFQERLDLDIPHEKDIALLVKNRNSNDAVQFLDLSYDFDIGFIEKRRLRDYLRCRDPDGAEVGGGVWYSDSSVVSLVVSTAGSGFFVSSGTARVAGAVVGAETGTAAGAGGGVPGCFFTSGSGSILQILRASVISSGLYLLRLNSTVGFELK